MLENNKLKRQRAQLYKQNKIQQNKTQQSKNKMGTYNVK